MCASLVSENTNLENRPRECVILHVLRYNPLECWQWTPLVGCVHAVLSRRPTAECRGTAVSPAKSQLTYLYICAHIPAYFDAGSRFRRFTAPGDAAKFHEFRADVQVNDRSCFFSPHLFCTIVQKFPAFDDNRRVGGCRDHRSCSVARILLKYSSVSDDQLSEQRTGLVLVSRSWSDGAVAAGFVIQAFFPVCLPFDVSFRLEPSQEHLCD